MVNLNQPDAPSSTYFIQECTISTTTDSSGQRRAYFGEEMAALVQPGPAFALMEDANGVSSTTDDDNEIVEPDGGAGGGDDEMELSDSEEEDEDDLDLQYDIDEPDPPPVRIRFILPPTPPSADNDPWNENNNEAS